MKKMLYSSIQFLNILECSLVYCVCLFYKSVETNPSHIQHTGGRWAVVTTIISNNNV